MNKPTAIIISITNLSESILKDFLKSSYHKPNRFNHLHMKSRMTTSYHHRKQSPSLQIPKPNAIGMHNITMPKVKQLTPINRFHNAIRQSKLNTISNMIVSFLATALTRLIDVKLSQVQLRELYQLACNRWHTKTCQLSSFMIAGTYINFIPLRS